jgi:hypothetical protein
MNRIYKLENRNIFAHLHGSLEILEGINIMPSIPY